MDDDSLRFLFTNLVDAIPPREQGSKLEILSKVTNMLKEQGRLEHLKALIKWYEANSENWDDENPSYKPNMMNKRSEEDCGIQEDLPSSKKRKTQNYGRLYVDNREVPEKKKELKNESYYRYVEGKEEEEETEEKKKIKKKQRILNYDRQVPEKKKEPKSECSYRYMDEEEEEEILEKKKIKKKQGHKNIVVKNDKKEAPPMPEKLKQKISLHFGDIPPENIVFVIQKVLSNSDVTQQQNRFSIPTNQMACDEFELVTKEEKKFLEKKNELDGKNNFYMVDVIQPVKQKVKKLKFARWVYAKGLDKQSSVSYVLNGGGWSQMAEKNGLVVDTEVQCWCFRKNDGNLCFAVVEV